MDHFSIVLALCRSAMQNPTPALTRHVGRLASALSSAGIGEQADALTKLVKSTKMNDDLEPSRVILSRAALPGEAMGAKVVAPVDRETAAPLAEILHPHILVSRDAPILNPELHEAVASLQLEWTNVDKLTQVGVRPPLNCLLFGSPGTGKTQLAYAIAMNLDLPLVVARLDGLISSFLGTTARNIATLFEFANRYKCILLLDEFDAVAKIRDDPHEVGEIKRVVNTLLQCLDARSKNGFTIAITNHEQLLDSAVWRRFDVRIQVARPKSEARYKIAAKYLSQVNLADYEIKLVSWLTEGSTGADIETLCNAIKRHITLNENSVSAMFEILKNYTVLNAGISGSPRMDLLKDKPEEVVRILSQDPELQLTQEQIAGILGKDQSTISRWKKRKVVTK